LREKDPEEYVRQAMKSMAIHVRAMLDFKRRGSIVLIMETTFVGKQRKQG
jgi:urocanate hydratase